MLRNIILFSFMLIILFIPWFWNNGYSYDNFVSKIYGAIHRDIWAFCWALILFECMSGRLSNLNNFFSWKPMTILSKLSFQAYLYHYLIIEYFILTNRTPIEVTPTNLVS